jgi:hypothetical protein
VNFIQHSSNNHVLRAPPGIPIEKCRPLPVTVLRMDDGGQACVSFWKPSQQEIEKITAGHPIALYVVGPHPAVMLAVEGTDGVNFGGPT